MVPSNRTRGNGDAICSDSSCCLNISKQAVKLRVTEHWYRLTREVVESLFLGIFKTCLDMVLGNWL